MNSPGAGDVLGALGYWGVPFASDETPEGAKIRATIPPHATWVVCESLETALAAQREGSPVVFVGSNAPFKPLDGDIVLGSLHEFPGAAAPHYTRTALQLRNVIASEFESA